MYRRQHPTEYPNYMQGPYEILPFNDYIGEAGVEWPSDIALPSEQHLWKHFYANTIEVYNADGSYVSKFLGIYSNTRILFKVASYIVGNCFYSSQDGFQTYDYTLDTPIAVGLDNHRKFTRSIRIVYNPFECIVKTMYPIRSLEPSLMAMQPVPKIISSHELEILASKLNKALL